MELYFVRLPKFLKTLNKRLKIFINYFLGPLLFVGLSVSIYRNIIHQKEWQQSLQQIKVSLFGEQAWKAVLVIFLMLGNWSFEALKWKTVISHIQYISFLRAFRAILSGLSVSLAMNTPNGAGEYVGRILYVKEGNRLRAITLTFVASMSQLIITMLLGIIGLFLMRHHFYNVTDQIVVLSLPVINIITWGSMVITIALLSVYFEISLLIRLLEKIPFVAKYSFFIQKLEDFTWPELLKILLISFLRYMVFVVQYLLLLQVFKVDIGGWNALWLIAVMFLVLAIIPTIALAELGVRGKISIFLFSVLSTNTIGIVLTATTIWLINLVVPALAGSLFILGIKLFRTNSVKKTVLIVILISLSSRLSAGDDFCGIRNNSFREGERISLIVYYNALGLYINAGTANITVSSERLLNKPVYHIVGTGATNSKYDWIFKVRDRYETYIDTATLQPYKFIRNVDEGGYKKYENITFNQAANTAITTKGVFKVPNCIQDVVGSMYYARNIDFNKYKPGDRIPFNMFLDNEVYNMYIRYEGKTTVKTRYGKFRAIKFKPLLLKGTIFEGGERMTVYVSDDGNKIPLRIESPLLVGSVKVDMMSYDNLRYPLSSIIRFR